MKYPINSTPHPSPPHKEGCTFALGGALTTYPIDSAPPKKKKNSRPRGAPVPTVPPGYAHGIDLARILLREYIEMCSFIFHLWGAEGVKSGMGLDPSSDFF